MAITKPSKIFGAGAFYGISNVTNPATTAFDTLQDYSLSFKRDTKSLFGEDQFADDVCAGPATVTGKVTTGSLNGRIFSDLVCGVANTDYMDQVAKKELGTVNGSSQIHVQNHGTEVFLQDLGVIDPTTNLPLVNVAIGAVTKRSHYSVTGAGIYTFQSSRQGDKMAITYRWQLNPAGNGTKLNIKNQPMGKIGDFTTVAALNWAEEQNVFTLNSCLSSDIEVGTKQGDYGKPTFNFMASVDDYGNLGTFSFAQHR